jgi:hypothetical protein
MRGSALDAPPLVDDSPSDPEVDERRPGLMVIRLRVAGSIAMEPKRGTALFEGNTVGGARGCATKGELERFADADVFGESLEPLTRFTGKMGRFIGLTRRG